MRWTPHSRLWLAACIWATEGDKEQVLRLIAEAEERRWQATQWAGFRERPEFAEVQDDPEFLAAAGY